MDNPKVIIYADGGCRPNPGEGGWACILTYKKHKKCLSGYEKYTTNNQMELTAVIRALSSLTKPCLVDLFIDSMYIKNGMENWIKNWKSNGWKTTGKKDIKNRNLWMELDALCEKHNVVFHWVPGHSGINLNEECDKMVSSVIDSKVPFMLYSNNEN